MSAIASAFCLAASLFTPLEARAESTFFDEALRQARDGGRFMVAVMSGDGVCMREAACPLARNAVIALDQWRNDMPPHVRALLTVTSGTLSRTASNAVGRAGSGHGLGYSLTAGFGVQLDDRVELVNLGGKIALFCAPGAGVSTTPGVSGAENFIQMLGCDNPADYKGAFVSAGLDVSLGPAGVVGVGAAYSVGVDLKQLGGSVVSRIASDPQFAAHLSNDLQNMVAQLKAAQERNFRGFFGAQLTASERSAQAAQAVVLLNILSRYVKEPMNAIQGDLAGLLHSLRVEQFRHPVKATVEVLRTLATAGGLSTLSGLLGDLNGSLTGCDSVSGHIGAGVSLLPAGGSVTVNHYVELAEIDGDSLRVLASMNSASADELWASLAQGSTSGCDARTLARFVKLQQTLLLLTRVTQDSFLDAQCHREAATELSDALLSRNLTLAR